MLRLRLILSLALLACGHFLAAEQASETFFLKSAPAELKAKVERYRENILLVGYRFDEKEGTILSPETKGPIRVPEAEELVAAIAAGLRHAALERLNYLLSRQKAGEPIPEKVLAEARQIAESERVPLPESLLKALKGAQKAPGALTLEVARAYIESTRYWDGAMTPRERFEASQPVVVGGSKEPFRSPYFDETEKRLGELLREELAAHLAKNTAGKELLDKLRGPEGKRPLPGVLVLKLDANKTGVYDESMRAIVLSHAQLVGGLVKRVPERERKALSERLQDPKALTEYLSQNPEARSAFVKDNDTILFHELTHAWQARRGRLIVEQERGNVPGMNLLENEHEAFLSEARYFHHKLLKDETAADSQDELDNYLGLLNDFDRWRDNITHSYLANWPESTADFPTVIELQRLRGRASGRDMQLLRPQFDQWLLKLIGLNLGMKAIQEEKTAHDKRVEEFLKKEYPRMQYDGFRRLAGFYSKRSKPDYAFLSLAEAEAAAERNEALLGAEALRRVRGETDRAMGLAQDWAKRANLPAQDQYDVLAAMVTRLDAQKKPWTQDFSLLYGRSLFRMAKAFWDDFQKDPGPKAEEALAQAESYLDLLAKHEFLRDQALSEEMKKLREKLAAERAKRKKEEKK